MRILKDLFKDYRFTHWFIVYVVFLAILRFSPYDPIEWLQVPQDRPHSWPHIGNYSKAMSFGKPPLP